MISKITSVSISLDDYLVFNIPVITSRSHFETTIKLLAEVFPEHRKRMVLISGEGTLSCLGDSQLAAIGLMRVPNP